MSEYQYHEFQTADRRLNEREMHELRSYSTRAVTTPTSFSNEYSFGSFKGNPAAWLEKYFDVFIYVANGGTHELQLALPSSVLSAETAELYCNGDAASAREKSEKLILTFRSEEEPSGEWVQGEGILSSLPPLRAALADGDLRPLYLGWLLNVQTGELKETEMEPVAPPNLGDVSGPLSELVDFLRIDRDLLAIASEGGSARQSRPAQRKEMAAWVAPFSAKEKDELLVRLLAGEDGILGAELRCRFHRSRAKRSPVPDVPRRSIGELLAAAKAFKERRQHGELRPNFAKRTRASHG